MKYLREYAGRIKKPALAFFLCCFTAGCVAFLYDLPAEPVIYGGILCTLIMLLFFLGRIPEIRKTKRNSSSDFR